MTVNDLLFSLAIEKIYHFSNPFESREQADLERVLFETLLINDSSSADKSSNTYTDEMKSLIISYVNLDQEKLISLPDEVNIWFLRKIIAVPAIIREIEEDKIITNLKELYFSRSTGLIHYFIINTLLALDSVSIDRPSDIADTYVVSIYNDLYKLDEPSRKTALLDELTNILIGANSSESDRALVAILNMENLYDREQEIPIVRSRVKKILPELSPRSRENLSYILRDDFGSEKPFDG